MEVPVADARSGDFEFPAIVENGEVFALDAEYESKRPIRETFRQALDTDAFGHADRFTQPSVSHCCCDRRHCHGSMLASVLDKRQARELVANSAGCWIIEIPLGGRCLLERSEFSKL